MKGVVFTEFFEFVEGRFSLEIAEALYRAKNAGRNRVVVWNPANAPSPANVP